MKLIMKKNKNFSYKKIALLLIPLVHFISTFFTDRYFIDFENYNVGNYILCKIILFVFLFMTWFLIYKVFNNIDKRKIIRIFCIYFIPTFLILIMIWPGIWYSDDFNLLNCAKTVDFLFFLNYFTSVFYSVSLMIIPIPTGVIIVQLFIVSVLATYTTYRLKKIYPSKLMNLIYFIFFMPMTLFYTLYSNRPIMYGIFYFGYFTILFLDYLEKKKISKTKFIMLCIYTSIIALWRSEGIYLVILGPLLITFIYYKKNYIKYISGCFVTILIIAIFINIPQYNATIGQSESYKFKRYLPSIINPLQWMITQDLSTKNLEVDLKAISKVLSIESMKKYSTLQDIPCAWQKDNCILNYSSDDIDDFKDAYIDILKNNPVLFAKAKIVTFIYALGIENNTYDSCNIFNNININESAQKFLNDYKYTHPFNNNLRKSVVRILEGRNIKTHNPIILYSIINNLLFPLIALGLLFIYSILKKKLVYFLMSGMLLGHAALIAINAPASYFMYYYPIYLIGYLILIFEITYAIKFLKNRKKVK